MKEQELKEKDEMEKLEKFIKKAEQENFVLKKLLETEEKVNSSTHSIPKSK